MPESLLTPQELATWLKMSRVWVYKQAEKGLLPFHRVGDAIRFDPEEIRSYLESRRGLKRGDLLVFRQAGQETLSKTELLKWKNSVSVKNYIDANIKLKSLLNNE